MRHRRLAIPVLGFLLIGAGGPLLASPPAAPISGVVRHNEAPVPGVLIILYNLGDSSLTRLHTASDGTFVLATAPVGVYDLVAYKKGFEPALRQLWHQAAAQQVSAVRIDLTRKGGAEPAVAAAPVPTTIWDLRDRLPTDVLRELGMEAQGAPAAPPASTQKVAINQFVAGEVSAMTDVAAGNSNAALSRGAVGLHGGLPNGWKYGINGDYATLGNSDAPGETTTGNAAGLALELAPSSAEHVSVTTRRNALAFGDSPASLQSHAVSWSRGAEQGSVESVAARYIEETNLYRATSAGAAIFPLASRTWEVNGRYQRPASDAPGVAVAMTYRHSEASVGPSGIEAAGAFLQSAPDADLQASASLRLSDQLEMQGGVVGRYLGSGTAAYGIAPTVTARYRVGNATVYARGLYRVAGSTVGATMVMPRVASIEESQDPASSEAFAVGFEQTAGPDTSLQVEVSQRKMGELVRAFFEGDFLTDFDSVYLLDGNSVRQYRASVQRRLSDKVAGSVTVRYGSIDGNVSEQSRAGYGISSNQGHFWSARAAVELLPTRTGIAILVRGIRQDLATPATVLANNADKLAVSVAQDLSVVGLTPFGAAWKLLVALETARGTAISDRIKEDAATANRLLGGVAVSF
jgi:hypothetical protein